jgi:hypothetical protein
MNALSEDNSLLQMPPWRNPWLLLAMCVSLGLHAVILYVPFLAGDQLGGQQGLGLGGRGGTGRGVAAVALGVVVFMGPRNGSICPCLCPSPCMHA